jgi:uncharacterized protein (UPF0264 family)
MARLLVSVRSAEEAQAALAGGADIIDIKEPSRGSLGMPDSATIENAVRFVAGKVPISVALGEYSANLRFPGLSGVTWAKLGFREAWRRNSAQKTLAPLLRIAAAIQPVTLVGVVYADHRRAFSPPFDVILDWQRKFLMPGAYSPGILIDTAIKDGKGLLCWKSITVLKQYQRRCQAAGLFMALAGSLNLDSIRRLLDHVQPDVIAVRGAACERNERNSRISPIAVQQLKTVVAGKAGK